MSRSEVLSAFDENITQDLKYQPDIQEAQLVLGQPTVRQSRRAIEALEARAPQYCDCGPDWPLLFKVHEI